MSPPALFHDDRPPRFHGLCSWCGKDSAPKLCPCRHASYCNEHCQLEAFTEHRLSCPCIKPSMLNHEVGGVVRIVGLTSPEELSMNGKLAEILQVKEATGMMRVVLTQDNGKIKFADISKIHLPLDMHVLAASFQDPPDTELKMRDFKNNVFEEPTCQKIENYRNEMSAADIVQGIRENDKYLIHAIEDGCLWSSSSPPVPWESLIGHGLLDALFEKFRFPDAVNATSPEFPASHFGKMLESCFEVLGQPSSQGLYTPQSWLTESSRSF